MQTDPNSTYEWRRPCGAVNKALERFEDAPISLFSRSPITDGRKRALYENGLEGKARILKAPSEKAVSAVKENLGSFKVSVELPDREPYEVKVRQSFERVEWRHLQPGAVVPCCVDRDNPKRVLLVAPE
jgi:hypothetical protein